MGNCTGSHGKSNQSVRSGEPNTPKKSDESGNSATVNPSAAGEMAWRNLGYDVYKGIMGEELFKQKIEEFEKPLPPPGIFDAAKIGLKTEKFKMLFGLKTLMKGERGTHPIGVGGQGIATIVSKPQFPACAFFTPGSSFPCSLRHSTIQSVDDVLIDFCGGALRFAGAEEESPCDIIMGTGPTTPLWSAKAIEDAVTAKVSGDLKTYLLLSPDNLAANIGGLRHKPDSFHDQRYYTEVIFDFKAFDGVKRYVRFRLIPADGSPETGLLTEEEQWQPWVNERSPTETKPMDYLKQEYKERLSRAPLEYKFQLQLHEAQEDDPPMTLQVGRTWDETTHPWLDLADVTITTLLSPPVTEHLMHNFDNLPPSLGILPAQSVDDPNVLIHIRNDVYKWVQKIRSIRSKTIVPDHMASYLIRVETGDRSGAGTDASISISLTGTKGKTDMISLDSWRNDFEGGRTDEYTVEAMDVGEVVMIHLHNDGGGWWYKNPDWFVRNISVISSKEEEVFEFPCHRWVLSDMIVFQGKGLLPFQEQPKAVQAHRVLQIQQNQEQYKWGALPGLEGIPGYLQASTHNDIPRDSQFSEEARLAIEESKQKAIVDLGLNSLLTLFENWDDFDDFKKILSRFTGAIPKIIENDQWMNDRVFGSLFLNGCNPSAIQRCQEIPANFPVTDDIVKPFLDRGLTLKEEIEAGRVYIVDYKGLEGIKDMTEQKETGYLAQPLGLFYVNTSRNLVPIAIQLFQLPSDTNPIWTPNDPQYDWLLAKMWLRHADYQIHEINTHLLKTHLVAEPFAVAAWRQLPSNHPVFQLLFPHLRSVMAINTIIRKKLSGAVSKMELLQKSYKAFKFGMLSLPEVLKERGIDEPEKLPNFHYREDSLCLWKAIADFIQEVIYFFYRSDDDVAKDSELQAWIQDVHTNGFPVRDGDVDHEFPKSLEARDQLVHVLTCVVFTCSCQHAVVNFGVMDVAAFIPITPFRMRLPPPTKKNEANLKLIMDTLPNKSQAGQHVAALYVTTRFADDEHFLGDYSQSLLTGDDMEEAFSRFQSALQQISDAIKARNASVDFPFTFLLPERIPDSIGL